MQNISLCCFLNWINIKQFVQVMCISCHPSLDSGVTPASSNSLCCGTQHNMDQPIYMCNSTSRYFWALTIMLNEEVHWLQFFIFPMESYVQLRDFCGDGTVELLFLAGDSRFLVHESSFERFFPGEHASAWGTTMWQLIICHWKKVIHGGNIKIARKILCQDGVFYIYSKDEATWKNFSGRETLLSIFPTTETFRMLPCTHRFLPI